jgi:hypothetical protein
MGKGLKQKRFFRFREKRKLSENEQVFVFSLFANSFHFRESFREKFLFSRKFLGKYFISRKSQQKLYILTSILVHVM